MSLARISVGLVDLMARFWYQEFEGIRGATMDFMSMSCMHLQALTDLAPKYILEQFLEAELIVNITEHSVSTPVISCDLNESQDFNLLLSLNLLQLGCR